MRIIEVIESKRWVNSRTGRTASIYGAVPYFRESEKSDWSIESVGWTWRLDNGTIGLGRVPVKTREEAQEIMTHYNTRKDEIAAEWTAAMKGESK